MLNNKCKAPLYLLQKQHHWCNDTAAESIGADKFLIKDFRFVPNSRIRSVLMILLSIYYAFALPRRILYVGSTIETLLILKLNKLLLRRNFKTIHVVFSDYYSTNHKGFERKFMNWVATVVDAAIVPGEMIKKEIRKTFNFPVEVSYHYPNSNDFFKIKADFKSKKIITVGIASRFRKGTDIFCKVASMMPKNEFYLLGNTKYIPKKFSAQIKKIKNLKITGHVDPKKYILRCAFYLLPGRYDAGPIALTEALASGLIPVVSNKLGGQDLVMKIRKDLVIDSLDPVKYYKKLKKLMKLNIHELRSLSRKSKKIASNWTRENGMADFKKKFEKLTRKWNLMMRIIRLKLDKKKN
jgi:glycosyltransferase involved in cell wall biosynthesis